MAPRIAGLYAIADTQRLAGKDLHRAVSAALAGGARVVQYRDKSSDRAKRLREARTLAALCREHAAVFIVNDDAALALEAEADGVHLGKDDVPIESARAQLSEGKLIGVSCYNDPARALAAQAAGADYVAFGSFFPSRTKPQAVRAEIDMLRETRPRLRVPVVAIGGITADNGQALLDAGADALAVVEDVFGAHDVHQAAARYARLFERRVPA